MASVHTDYKSYEAAHQTPKERIARARARHEQQVAHFKYLLEERNAVTSVFQESDLGVAGDHLSIATSSMHLQMPPNHLQYSMGNHPQDLPVQQGPNTEAAIEVRQEVVSPLTNVASPAQFDLPTGSPSNPTLQRVSTIHMPTASRKITPILRSPGQDSMETIRASLLHRRQLESDRPELDVGFTPATLQTLDSTIKDHIILRQQGQIFELKLQKKEALASVDAMLSQFTSLNSKDQNDMHAREQGMIMQLQKLQRELDNVKSNDLEREQLKKDLAEEREHLRFAVGKISRFEKREKAINGYMASLGQSKYGKNSPSLATIASTATSRLPAPENQSVGTSVSPGFGANPSRSIATSYSPAEQIKPPAALVGGPRPSTVKASINAAQATVDQATSPRVDDIRSPNAIGIGDRGYALGLGSAVKAETAPQQLKHRSISKIIAASTGEFEETGLVASPGGTFPTWNI